MVDFLFGQILRIICGAKIDLTRTLLDQMHVDLILRLATFLLNQLI
jgi:hypothetical protein